MRYMIELTDTMDGNTEPSATVPADQVAATVRGWYGGPGAMLTADTDAIQELQDALVVEDYSTARDIAAELAIGFDAVQVQDA